MTDDILQKANQLTREISDLESFLLYSKSCWHIRFFKKKIMCTVSDYMKETRLYELTKNQRLKFIAMLEEELVEKKKQLEQLN